MFPPYNVSIIFAIFFYIVSSTPLSAIECKLGIYFFSAMPLHSGCNYLI